MSRTTSRARRMNVLAAMFIAASSTAVAAGAALAAPQAPVAVFIKAEHLDGTRPDGGPVTLRLNFDVSGNDVSALAGTGTAFGTSGAHIEWSLTGSMDGDVLTLSGVATDANNPALIGMPGSGVANAVTGTVTWSWTIQSGPFAGRSGIVQGEAKVDIRVK
jgi:hypothetical protein